MATQIGLLKEKILIFEIGLSKENGGSRFVVFRSKNNSF
jgi:hypothetical protein